MAQVVGQAVRVGHAALQLQRIAIGRDRERGEPDRRPGLPGQGHEVLGIALRAAGRAAVERDANLALSGLDGTQALQLGGVARRMHGDAERGHPRLQCGQRLLGGERLFGAARREVAQAERGEQREGGHAADRPCRVRAAPGLALRQQAGMQQVDVLGHGVSRRAAPRRWREERPPARPGRTVRAPRSGRWPGPDRSPPRARRPALAHR